MNTQPTFFKTVLTSFQYFARSESAGGLLLICTAALAIGWANTPWADSYFHMKEVHLRLGWGSWGLDKTLAFWVNDLFMAIFFLLVGLEIKREVLAGELAGVRRALWPAAAAVGGMIVPAAIYAAINWNAPSLRGWAIPMATDIAFALGILSLLGKRVPLALKVFLTALAIVDDLGAVLLIAIFYTGGLHLVSLAIVGGVSLLCVLYAWLHGRSLWVLAVLGIVLWYFTYRAGVHPTVAGVLLAMTVPIGAGDEVPPRADEDEHEDRRSPLRHLEHSLTPWVAFGIMPLFALFNAGIRLDAGVATVSSVNVGIFLGLLLGNPIAIVGASWLAAKAGWITLPAEVRWLAMIGAGLLGGIGFTMALFITMLAFSADSVMLDQAKLAVLATSAIAAAAGLIVLLATTSKTAEHTDQQP